MEEGMKKEECQCGFDWIVAGKVVYDNLQRKTELIYLLETDGLNIHTQYNVY